MGEQKALQILSYGVRDGTRVRFEIEAGEQWQQVTSVGRAGPVLDAVSPAVEGAREHVKDPQLGQGEATFGVRAAGAATWLTAGAATEAHFEITLAWPGLELPRTRHDSRR
ncbi:hypothetical protein STRCI_008370 [Streptomyces cinnabarinus]|uniref:Trypsin-co-occurring domain-containing protein n=1 Tax=Streptomyces cinnabarinus TaxID=67287 RepID=A0ABY7KTK6_9ACTN|nr:CU044_2847 family protein [Streptomyces cinnabarinus]WAZ26742.1 hypothetical protein STRCI_008370 [Streptomyces cinnabarinus]